MGHRKARSNGCCASTNNILNWDEFFYIQYIIDHCAQMRLMLVSLVFSLMNMER